MTGRRVNDLEVGRPAAGEPQAQAWLARWAGLVKLPPAQARTAAMLLAAAAVGIALMGLPDLFVPSSSRQEAARPSAARPSPSLMPATTLNSPPPERPGYGEEVERELEAILGLMDGVGSVKVFITWAQGPEQVVAFNETVEQRTLPGVGPDAARSQATGERRVQRQVAIIRDSEGRRETPVVLTERYPVVKGVMVVADGARDPKVRLAIQRAVAAA
ncbi:MAG: hypothetical protein AB1609_12710, partial [Bacillota bacterium]